MMRVRLLAPRLAHTSTLLAALLLLSAALPEARARQASAPGAQASAANSPARRPFAPLAYRQIGPFRGGRVAAVAGVAGQPNVYYFGATGGGVWKTTDGGRELGADLGRQTLQDRLGRRDRRLGVRPERHLRRHGRVADSRQRLARRRRVQVDRRGQDVEAASASTTRATSRACASTRATPTSSTSPRSATSSAPNEERGVFRSKDGGKTWEKILYRGRQGGRDRSRSFDPSNPNVLYAGLLAGLRTPWALRVGGPGERPLQIDRRRRHVDGDDAQHGAAARARRQDRHHGLAGQPRTRLGHRRGRGRRRLPLRQRRRARGRGSNEQRNLRQRAWYYTRIYADPQNRRHRLRAQRRLPQIDRRRPHLHAASPSPHGDNHDLWIAPNDSTSGWSKATTAARTSPSTAAARGRSRISRPRSSIASPSTTISPTTSTARSRTTRPSRSPSRTDDFGIDRARLVRRGRRRVGLDRAAPRRTPNIVFAGSYGGYLTRYDHRTGQQRNDQRLARQPDGRAGPRR